MKEDSLLPPGRSGCSRGCGRVGLAVEALDIVDAGGERMKPPLWGGELVAMVAMKFVRSRRHCRCLSVVDGEIGTHVDCHR